MKLPGKNHAPTPTLLPQSYITFTHRNCIDFCVHPSSCLKPGQQKFSGTNLEHKEVINPQRMQCVNMLDIPLSN